MMTLSVISSSSRCGGTRASSRSAPISSGSETSIRSRVDRLTDTVSSIPASRHVRAWASAVRAANSVSERMRPLRSASGMKRSGIMTPWRGCRHRMSASAPTMRPVRRSAFGW